MDKFCIDFSCANCIRNADQQNEGLIFLKTLTWKTLHGCKMGMKITLSSAKVLMLEKVFSPTFQNGDKKPLLTKSTEENWFENGNPLSVGYVSMDIVLMPAKVLWKGFDENI